MGWRRLFSFRKRSLSFLTVDATNGNQAFCHDRCNKFSGLRYNKANDTFFSSLRKSDVEAQVKLDQVRFLGNCPPVPPLIEHFALSEK